MIKRKEVLFMDEIERLEEEIEKLPKGYISNKMIGGKVALNSFGKG